MEPPVDDTRLWWDADAWLASSPDLDEAALRTLVAERGVDFATAVLFRWVRRRDAAVVAAVEGFGDGPPPHIDADLLLVPASGYVERPAYGGDGAVIRSIGASCGMRPHLVATRSLGGVTENAATLRDALSLRPPRSVVLVTLSKGAAEAKVALREPGPHRDAVRAWVSVGGLPHGSPMVDWGNRRARTWLVAHALIASGRASRGFFYEMFHRPALLEGPVALPDATPTVSILGFPLRWHLDGTLAGRHANVAPLGPNDGFGLLWDAVHQGPVVPVWGASHYLRSPGLSRLFYGAFAWLAQNPSNIPPW